MATPPVRGRFVWHELLTTDTNAAAAFFTKVVGWKTQAWDHDPSYVMFVTGARPMAGLMALPEDARQMGAPPHWEVFIGTPNVDETARQAVTLGARILKQPADIPTVGRFAVIQDPQGAVFSAFTPLQGPAAPEGVPGLGDFSWHELSTTDWRAALAFYQSLFGWEATGTHDMGPEMGTYQMFGSKERTVGGMMNKPAQQSGPAAWLPYIKVADSKKAAAIVKKLGAQIVHGPAEVPGGDLIALGIDPQGAFFAVHSSKPAAAKKPAVKKTTAKKAAAKKPAAKKPAAKKPVAKKRAAKKPAAKRAKRPAKRGATKRTAKKARRAGARKATGGRKSGGRGRRR